MNDVAIPEPLLNLDPKQYAAAVYDPFAAGVQAFIAECAKPLPEATTPAGMKACVERRAAGRTLRVAVEKARQERKAPVLEIGRLLDARAKEITAQIAPGEDAADAEIKRAEAIKEAQRKAAEEAERARQFAIHQRIANDIVGAVAGVAHQGSAVIATTIADVEAIAVEVATFAEFTLAKLRQLHTAALAREEQAAREKAEREAEAARLKADREKLEQERREQAERDRLAAAERAKAEAEAKAARDAEEARLKAQREAFEAEQRRQREELARQQAEVKRQLWEAEEAAARAKAEAQEREAAEHRRRQAIADEEVRKAREAAEAEKRRQAEIAAARRPSDDDLIAAVRKVFWRINPSDEEVIGWLQQFDAEDARSKRMLAAA